MPYIVTPNTLNMALTGYMHLALMLDSVAFALIVVSPSWPDKPMSHNPSMFDSLTLVMMTMLWCRISWAAGQFEGTVVGHLLHSNPELHPIAPHVLLALMWASLVCQHVQ